jgi:Na+-driven multidrug efflux pump
MVDDFLKREGLLIAVCTLLIYASIYFFERGYCLELNIPLDCIEISIPTIANDFLNLYLFLLPVGFTSMAIMLSAEDNQHKWWYRFASLLCGILYMLFLFHFSENTIIEFIICVILGLGYPCLISFKTFYKKGDSRLKNIITQYH